VEASIGAFRDDREIMAAIVFGAQGQMSQGACGKLGRNSVGKFRRNTRKMNDGHRVAAAIKQIDGKRLEYRESVENPPYAPKPSGQMTAPFEEEF
jgi:hypothetical protein